MKSIKHVTIAFWAVNLLLGVGIVAYAATAFIGKPPSPLADVADIGGDDGQAVAPTEYSRNTTSMQRMGVIQDKKANLLPQLSVNLAEYLAIKSTYGTTNLLADVLKTQGAQVNIFLGDDVSTVMRGKLDPVPDELRGWKLTAINGPVATFTKGDEKQELKVGENVAVGGDQSYDAYRGLPYKGGDYKTQQTMTGANRQAWMMDPEEVKWAVANQDSVLGTDVTFGQAQGGLRIQTVRAGSIVANRGFAANDVVMAVNGVTVATLEDINKLRDHPSFQNPNVISVKVNRAGQDVYLTYSIPRPPAKP